VGGGGVKGAPAGLKGPPAVSAAEVERLKRQVAEIRTAVAARDEELSRLKGAVKKRERAVADAREALDRKDRKIAALERDLEDEKGPPTGDVVFFMCRTKGCRTVLRVTLDEGEGPEDFAGRCPECNGKVDWRRDIDDDKTGRRVAKALLEEDERATAASRPKPRFVACPNRDCGNVVKVSGAKGPPNACPDCGDELVQVAAAHNIDEAVKICGDALTAVADYMKRRRGDYYWGLHADFPGYPESVDALAREADHRRSLADKLAYRNAKRRLGRELYIWKLKGDA
jgi:hypothetical protein